jgi:plasmid maintenance system antidote protein VapI
MARSKKVFVVHPGEILKTEFMEPMGVSAYELAKALNFPASMKSSGETGPSAPTRPFA